MCWNADVSLNTFLFGGFVLLLIMYNNTYTQYKIQSVRGVWTYLFYVSVVSMQLVEFFIWRNVDNTFYNRVFSTLAATLLLVQPAVSLMTLPKLDLRNKLLAAYLMLFLPYFTYKLITNKMKSQKSSKGHLVWLFFDTNMALYFAWLAFFLFPFVYTRNFSGLAFALSLFFIAAYNYYNDLTIGSMWCWAVNAIMIYLAVYLLMVLPFVKAQGAQGAKGTRRVSDILGTYTK